MRPLVSEDIQRKIQENLPRFSLPALLDLLEYLGFESKDIRFESNPSLVSQGRLIEKIQFPTLPHQKVVITLNAGLLGPHALVPSYFYEFMDENDQVEEYLVHFLQFLDHPLLSTWVASFYGERNKQLFSSWSQTKIRFLSFLSLRSVGVLHWMFQLVYPELKVQVSPHKMEIPVPSYYTRLGHVQLGDKITVLSRAKTFVPGILVKLIVQEERTPWDTPWVQEVRQRFDKYIRPLLEVVGVHLMLFLVVLSQKSWMRVGGESLLGVDQIKGEETKVQEILVLKEYIHQKKDSVSALSQVVS